MIFLVSNKSNGRRSWYKRLISRVDGMLIRSAYIYIYIYILLQLVVYILQLFVHKSSVRTDI